MPDAPAKTREPCVKVVLVPVPPFATGKMPATPVVNGSPVALVNVPLLGVPRAPPLITGAPAEPALTPRAVAIPVPNPVTPVEIGNPVALVSVPALGVPRAAPLITGAPAEPTLTPRAVTMPVPVVMAWIVVPLDH